MARAVWSGSLAFGLVDVPVELYSATDDHTLHFHQLQRGTTSRVRNRRVNEDTGEEVPYGEIVRAADVGGGQYVVLTPEELDEVAPGRSRTIDISDFVELASIDPVHYRTTYYLAPQHEGAQRPYALLLQALQQSQRVGIASLVMRSKQYLAAIRAQGEVLTLQTMFFADEVRDPLAEIDLLPAQASFRSRDLDMAVALIDSMTTDWEPTNYRDTYRDRVAELIEAKRSGDQVVVEAAPEPVADVVDLMEALRASVEAARGRQAGGRDGGPRTTPAPVPPVSGHPASDEPAPGAPATADPAGQPADDLAQLSKKDLYDLAQELGVPGRSRMSRDELAEAVGRTRRPAVGRAS